MVRLELGLDCPGSRQIFRYEFPFLLQSPGKPSGGSVSHVVILAYWSWGEMRVLVRVQRNW